VLNSMRIPRVVEVAKTRNYSAAAVHEPPEIPAS
jgi:hypothetical protein